MHFTTRNCVVQLLLRAELFSCLFAIIMTATTEGTLKPHCLQISNGKGGKTINDFQPIQMNDTELPEPYPDADDIMVDICPNKTTLKISWKMKRNTGGDMKMCYRLKGIFRGQHLFGSCVKLTVQYSKHSSNIMCWFPMQYLSYRPIISVHASTLEEGHRKSSHFGQLNTNALDDGGTCKHVCQLRMIKVKRVLLCNYRSYLEFDRRISVRGLNIYPIDSAICKETLVQGSRKKSRRLEFSLNCIHSGLVNITVYYRIRGHYCTKFYTARMICESVTTTSMFSTEPQNKSDFSTYTFITMGIVLFTLINAVLFYFVIKRSRRAPRIRQNSNDMNDITNGSNVNPLILNNSSIVKDNKDSSQCLFEMVTKV